MPQTWQWLLRQDTKNIGKKENIDKLNFKIKNFYASKDMMKEMKGQSTEWEKYLQIIYLQRVCYSEHIMNLELNNRKTTTQGKDGQRT